MKIETTFTLIHKTTQVEHEGKRYLREESQMMGRTPIAITWLHEDDLSRVQEDVQIELEAKYQLCK